MSSSIPQLAEEVRGVIMTHQLKLIDSIRIYLKGKTSEFGCERAVKALNLYLFAYAWSRVFESCF